MQEIAISQKFDNDHSAMDAALRIARLGQGYVEPNPCVGALLTNDDGQLLAAGWHQKFGGPHAEAMAIEQAGTRAQGATLYVTLEPCAHYGKTPPCADAVIAAGVKRVVIATPDPAPHTSGQGIAKLSAAGIDVNVGICQSEADRLIAPFKMLFVEQRPWVHAKWAMTLDGKIATNTGSSQWITNERSRGIVHLLRGRMDAILVGINTALADDPLLTPRPPGPRTPTRIVLDRQLRLSRSSKLANTAKETPVLVVTSPEVPSTRQQPLLDLGVKILPLLTSPLESQSTLKPLLLELGRRRMTNLLVEGGAHILGTFHDEGFVDEVHCFIAPKIVGGDRARTAVGGRGGESMPDVPLLDDVEWQILGSDAYLHGFTHR
ncbi:MAG: bifunctional diaminohydroxyphosphoribosylaminopyrimidine deaminase/5-amino-6-(5-phosphoribosylamino)uracil reductase RibD [Planctomycetaceae bacterium]|nr:bifunctional diaminohydroxyphosphoribosylaminopyrimidine deaminase/5-amino-6-(5-phosphoribosylamino)uracil reductase RibD [Planctomycetaceae bacterium]